MKRLVLCLPLLLAAGCSATPLTLDWEVVETGVLESFRGLSAASNEVVWASGSHGAVLRSVDGGRSWQDRSVPDAAELDLRDIEAFSEREALAITAGSPARIYVTDDGGATWRKTYEDDRPEIFFDAMAFWDRDRGIAFGDPIDGSFSVITTADGGESWLPVDAAALPPALEGEAGFAASGSCLTVQPDGQVWFGTGGSVARVFHSADFGVSWSVSPTPILAGENSTGIFSLAFADERNGVAVGGNYREPEDATRNIAFTRDGGRSWNAPPVGPAGFRSAVHFLDETGRLLIAVGSAGGDYTIDGGELWLPLGQRGFHALAVVRESDGVFHGWAIGADGVAGRLITGTRPQASGSESGSGSGFFPVGIPELRFVYFCRRLRRAPFGLGQGELLGRDDVASLRLRIEDQQQFSGVEQPLHRLALAIGLGQLGAVPGDVLLDHTGEGCGTQTSVGNDHGFLAITIAEFLQNLSPESAADRPLSPGSHFRDAAYPFRHGFHQWLAATFATWGVER